MMSGEGDKTRHNDDMYLAAGQLRRSIKRLETSMDGCSEKTFLGVV